MIIFGRAEPCRSTLEALCCNPSDTTRTVARIYGAQNEMYIVDFGKGL